MAELSENQIEYINKIGEAELERNNGNFAKSYEYFDIAKKKSSGRCFRKCDKKYKEFYSDYDPNKEIYLNYDANEEEKLIELSDEIYDQIIEYSEQGNDYCDNEEWEKAIICFNKALELLPEPKEVWEAATWIYIALGDAFFLSEKYEEALDNLKRAVMCPDGMANPFILLRLGESYYELGEMDLARKYLFEAYMMEGTEIFELEDEKYFDVVKALLDEKKL